MSDTSTAAQGVRDAAEDAVHIDKENAKTVEVSTECMNGNVVDAAGPKDPLVALTPEEEQTATPAHAQSEDANDSNAKAIPADATTQPEAEALSANNEAVPAETANGVADAAADGQSGKAEASGAEKGQEKEETGKPEALNVEAVEASAAEESRFPEEKLEDAIQASSTATEETKTEPTSPNSLRKQQKASFNIDAKPFSPVALAEPVMPATLVGESNGVSIKIGQWGNQPLVPMPYANAASLASAPPIFYPPPGAAQSPPVKKEGSGLKESLSAFAKPWSPHPEVVGAPLPPPENEVAIHTGSWSTVQVEGKEVQTPSPMTPKETSSNSFTHSFSIHPKGLKSVELELLNYVCGRCPLKTLYGRLSSRQPDVTMRNVVMDIPPLCVAHLIEQITKAKVTALCVNEVEGTHYDIWLDKPNMATVLAESMSGCVWTCPMHHGYAVLGKGEEGKKYLRNYVDRLKDSRPEGPNVYDVALVEVKEH